MNNSVISNEWDLIALDRLKDRRNNGDTSYQEILKPRLLSKLKTIDCSKLLDIGCGTGELTFEVANLAKNITALDLSPISIKLAQQYYSSPNIEFLNQDIESFTRVNSYSGAYSNMAMMDMIDIKSCLTNTYSSLVDGASFIFTITHPAFWPLYWKYCEEEGFNYLEKTSIIRDFKTRNKTFTNLKTHHFHRPISEYINSAIDIGFEIKECQELSDLDNTFWFPRFILFELKKAPNTKYKSLDS